MGDDLREFLWFVAILAGCVLGITAITLLSQESMIQRLGSWLLGLFGA
jgi:hypothetical protein